MENNVIPMPTEVANNENLSPVVNGWSFVAFCRSHGVPELTKRANKSTGELFDTIVMSDGTFVGYSSRSFDHTPSKAEILAQKDKLRVVLLDSGNYKLCIGQEFAPGETISLAELGIE